MIRAPWLLLVGLVAAGCLEARQPYSDVAEIVETDAQAAPAKLVVRQRLDLGGRAVDVAVHPLAVLVATNTGVDVFPTGAYEPAERISIPGKPEELLLDGSTLWIAAGHGGLVRVTDALDPAKRTTTRWSSAGEVRSLALQNSHLWAGLGDGRLWVLARDASADAIPTVHAVDGWPSGLAVWRDDVLVAASAGGIHAVRLGPDGLPLAVSPPITEGYALSLLPLGDDLYVGNHAGLFRHTPHDGGRIAATQRPKDLVEFRGGVLAAVGKEGLLEWDGVAQGVAAHPLMVEDSGRPVVARALAVIDDEHVVVAADEMGVFWLARTVDGWKIEHRHRYLGRIDALAWVDGRLAAGVTGSDSATVVFVDRDEQGLLRARESVSIPLDINGMLQVERELLVAGVGVHVVDLDDLTARAQDTGLIEGSVEGPIRLPSGRVVGLQKEEAVVWLEKAAGGSWTEHARSPIGYEFTPMSLASLGERVGVGYGGHGRLKTFDTPGEPETDNITLGATAVHRDGPFMRPSGVRVAHGKFRVTCPYLGVESVDPTTRATSMLRVQPGVADVCEFGDLLGAALGKGGAGLLDPAQPEAPLVAHVELPGDARVVLADGDELIVAASGALFVVGRPESGVRH